MSNLINDQRSRVILEICNTSEQLSIQIHELKFDQFNTPQLNEVMNYMTQQLDRIQARVWDFLPNKKAKN